MGTLPVEMPGSHLSPLSAGVVPENSLAELSGAKAARFTKEAGLALAPDVLHLAFAQVNFLRHQAARRDGAILCPAIFGIAGCGIAEIPHYHFYKMDDDLIAQ